MNDQWIIQKKFEGHYENRINLLGFENSVKINIQTLRILFQFLCSFPSFRGLNMNKVSRLNADIIKDLDYLKEQNDQEYGKLVGKIGCLQDRIVK